MANLPEPQRTWAQNLCIEAFAERGIPLSEDDSIILVAAIFRRALDDWKRESDASAAAMALAFRRRVEAELGGMAGTFAAQLRTDALQTASVPGSATGSFSSDSDRWRFRFEGMCAGLVLIGLFVLVRAMVH